MTKEENSAVKEVEVVLEVVKNYLDKKQDMPVEVLEEVLNKLKAVKEEYKKTINDMLLYNSLAVQYEELVNIIGTISTISIEDEDKFDKTITKLNDCVRSIKD